MKEGGLSMFFTCKLDGVVEHNLPSMQWSDFSSKTIRSWLSMVSVGVKNKEWNLLLVGMWLSLLITFDVLLIPFNFKDLS